MPRSYSNIDKIRAELAWVNEPVDPNVCGCRHLLCCEQTKHASANVRVSPLKRCGVFRWEYLLEFARISTAARELISRSGNSDPSVTGLHYRSTRKVSELQT